MYTIKQCTISLCFHGVLCFSMLFLVSFLVLGSLSGQGYVRTGRGPEESGQRQGERVHTDALQREYIVPSKSYIGPFKGSI